MIKPRTTVNTQAGSSVPCERCVRSNLSAGRKFVRCPVNESLKTIPVPYGMKFLWEFIFADWRIFCVLRELIFAIRTDWFFSLGKIFAIFRKYPVPSIDNIIVSFCNRNTYRAARNFCGSLFLQVGDFLCFAGTNFCDYDRLVFLAGN